MLINDYVKQPGKSASKLARDIGVSRGRISTLANGKQTASMRVVIDIIKATNGEVSAECILAPFAPELFPHVISDSQTKA